MKGLSSTWIVALAFAAGFGVLACRAHVPTPASADRDGCPELGARGEITWGLAGVDAGPPESAPPPAVDSDGDGIPDLKDACPLEPEDFDNFEDNDGCPDLDNDHDGIPDVKDKCPNQPETYNGFEDADGCPDASRIRWGFGRKMRITTDPIAFDDNSAVIRPSTAAVLDSIVAYTHAYPESVTGITVEGHAEAYERSPPALAAARAAAVRRYLLKHGIPSSSIQPAWHPNDHVHQMLGNEGKPEPDRRRVDVHVFGEY